MNNFNVTPKHFRIENGIIRGSVNVTFSPIVWEKENLVLHLTAYKIGNYGEKIGMVMPKVNKSGNQTFKIDMDSKGHKDVSVNIHVMQAGGKKAHVSSELFFNILENDIEYGLNNLRRT